MDRADVHSDHHTAHEFDLQGRLGNFAISDILQMVSFSGKTGTLTLIQGWNTRTISFDQGRICYVAAGARLPGMFDLLVRIGRLQRHQVEGFRARRPGKSDEEMLAELVQRNLLGREDLERCHELLLETAVYTLFLWRNCVFTFKAGEMVQEGGVAVTVDGNHLIIEGTRRVDEWIEISPVVPSVFMIFRQRPHLIERTVPESHRRVYDLVDGQRDVATIARLIGISQFEAARALYDLVRARHAEAIPPTRRRSASSSTWRWSRSTSSWSCSTTAATRCSSRTSSTASPSRTGSRSGWPPVRCCAATSTHRSARPSWSTSTSCSSASRTTSSQRPTSCGSPRV